METKGDSSKVATLPWPLIDVTNSEEAVRMIKEDIRTHEFHITLLKSHQNAFLPVSRLPPEVLSSVFYIVSQDTSDFDWIKVSHVSRHWRGVALNSASLWTRPPLENTRWTNEWLARSQMANITVDVSSKTHNTTVVSSLAKIFSSHASRMSHLKFVWHLPNAISLLNILPRSAPALESCVFKITPGYSQHGALKVPDESLRELGRIRCLELTGVAINWDVHLYNTLTKLILHDIPKSSLPTITQFWDALKRMPLLETLDLKDSLPIIEKTILRQDTINLSSLRTLTIMSTVVQAETFLRNIAFPPAVAMKFNSVYDGSIGHPDFTGLLSILVHSTKYSGSPTRLSDVSLSTSQLRFRTFGNPIPHFANCIPIDNETPLLDLSLSWKNNGMRSMEEVLGQVFQELSLDEVVELRVLDDQDQLSGRTILETYGALPKLETLITKINHNHLYALQETLPAPPPTLSNPSTSDIVSFPCLLAISMSGTEFTSSRETGNITIEALLKCLKWRTRHGAKINALMLDGCIYMTSYEVNLLRKEVVDVKWNNVELGSDELEEEEEEEEIEEHDEFSDGCDFDSDDEHLQWWKGSGGRRSFY